MSIIPKDRRVYPYNSGLLLGMEVDIVLSNENSEPIDAETLFEVGKKFTTEKSGGGGEQDNEELNYFKTINGMIRLFTKFSYCRAFTVDNVWWTMKQLVIQLKKRAFLSYVPYFLAEDFSIPKNDGMSYVAAGHIKTQITNTSIYTSQNSTHQSLFTMTNSKTDESHQRLKDNIRLILGILSTILDRREFAEFRRTQYGPGSSIEFRETDQNLVYQTPTNFWIFSPALAHMMLGAMRMAYFITLNKIEPEIWEGFEPGDVNTAIKTSNYEMSEEIWRMTKGRLGECGYKVADNPFWQHLSMLIEFIAEKSPDVMTGGIYKNWNMSRKKTNFQGHFAHLPSWENSLSTIFTQKNPNFKDLERFRNDYERREKERT